MNVRFGLVALVLGVAAVLSSANSASAFFGHGGCGCDNGCGGHRCCLFNLFHKHDCCEPCCCEETCGCEASCGCAEEASCAAVEEPSCGCAAEASCGCEASCCDPCCKPRRCCILGCLGKLFHRHRGCCAPSCCEASCGCEAAPSCGCGG